MESVLKNSAVDPVDVEASEAKAKMIYFVPLTILPKRIESYFRAQDILAVQRDDENLLETVVVVLTPKGAQPFKVAEPCHEVAEKVDRWFRAQLEANRRG